MQIALAPKPPVMPDRVHVLYVRSKLDDVQRYSQSISQTIGAGLPAGPMTPQLRGAVRAMSRFAAAAAIAADRSARMVRRFQEEGSISLALRNAITGVQVLGDRMQHHDGYLRGLHEAGIIPADRTAMTRIKRDADAAYDRATKALAAIDAAGWPSE